MNSSSPELQAFKRAPFLGLSQWENGNLTTNLTEKRAVETLIAPRNIPHQLRNSGNVANHYLIMFSPSGFEGFLRATSVPALDNAVALTESPAVAVRNVFELASDYGIQFG